MKNTLLNVRDLSVSFDTPQGTVQALRKVSFHVDAGEIVGVVGESGSGKSITMLSCMGLLARNGRVTSGSIRLEDRELSPAGLHTPRALRAYNRMMNQVRGNKLSMVFQDPMTFLNPVLTIGTQVTEGIRAHTHCSRKEAWQKGVRLLEQVGISEPERRMRQYPYEFSGGMRQRIIIAIALSCEPELLIADEPTTALDVTVQAQILELIREKATASGTAVVMITHDLGVVASLCSRIMILYGGRVMEEGTTDEIFYEAKHPYTQGLLNSVAKRRDGTDEPLETIPGTPPDLLHMHDGCPFVSRCEKAMRICKDYAPAEKTFSENHRCACWLYCREQAPALVAEQDRLRGETHG